MHSARGGSQVAGRNWKLKKEKIFEQFMFAFKASPCAAHSTLKRPAPELCSRFVFVLSIASHNAAQISRNRNLENLWKLTPRPCLPVMSTNKVVPAMDVCIGASNMLSRRFHCSFPPPTTPSWMGTAIWAIGLGLSVWFVYLFEVSVSSSAAWCRLYVSRDRSVMTQTWC